VSSPLEGRIRSLAREEVAALLGGAPAGSDNTDPDRLAALEATVTSLHGTVLRLEARLDALEKTASHGDREAPSTARRTRKTID
jgi:hypothetical protein